MRLLTLLCLLLRCSGVRGCSCRAAQSDGRCARACACASERLGRGVGKQTVLLTNLLPTRLYGRPLSGKRRVCVQRTVGGARSRYGRDFDLVAVRAAEAKGRVGCMHEDPSTVELMFAMDALDESAQVLFAADAWHGTKMDGWVGRRFMTSGCSTVHHWFACDSEC
jgi:hypothetical protein